MHTAPTLLTLPEIEAAARRIAPAAVRTPLEHLPAERLRALGLTPPPFDLYVKIESAQPIGSFKLRGAYNMAASLAPDELRRGLITYSSGNHAQGVAFAARALGVPAVIVMPDNAPSVKIQATRALGAEVVFVGPASSARKERAEALAAAHGYTIIPPYDHPAIIAGQATCGLEIAEQFTEQHPNSPQAGPDLVLAPVSGGGLLSGIATALKLLAAAGRTNPALQVIGAEPELAGDAAESFRSRTLVRWSAEQTSRTLSDGLRTESLGTLNFHHILQHVDGIVTVSEDHILEALRAALRLLSYPVEPSGAVTLAAALFTPHLLPPARTVVAVLSGGNIDPALRDSLAPGASAPGPVHVHV